MDNMWPQQWALIRRYGLQVRRRPISSFFLLFLWPGFLLGICTYASIQLEEKRKEKPTMFGILQYPLYLPTALTIIYVYRFGGLLIQDKSTEMKKLMLSMGLTRFNYYCANSICFQMYVLPISLAIAIMTKVYIVDETVSWPIIILMFTLFALHLDSATSFLVSFISSSSYSFVFLILIFLEAFQQFFLQYMMKDANETLKSAIVALTSISPYLPIRTYFYGYLKRHENEYLGLETQDWPAVFAEQIVWIILLRAFAVWFEEVCPWQKVSAVMGPCFCFNKQEDRYGDIEDSESIAVTSKYFEQRAKGGEVGIKINCITKLFNHVPALDDVSFSIYKGETTLLLGHNGAGKTTLMNIILGMLNPDIGNVRIKKSSGKVAAVGVCPQTSILDMYLTVREHLELFNDIKSNIGGVARARHIQQTIMQVSLGSHANKLPDELSGGMKRKLSLGMAFVGESDVLILDEPSSGLDPDSRTFIWNAIRKYRKDRTVLLSTQHMEEADYLGDRIAIMSAGQIVCCGSSVYLNKLFGTGYKLRIECNMSKREEILDYVRGYFDDAQPDESQDVSTGGAVADINADIVVELKMKNKDEDAELALIRLLEDFESDSGALGILSYGLKSSSIEDVMLNSNKYFSTTKTKDTNESTVIPDYDQSDEVGLIKAETSSNIINALCLKQLQVYRFCWKYVLWAKIILPIAGCFLAVITIGQVQNWLSPVYVLMIGHYIYFPIRERVSKFKIMQLESSISVWHYWLSQIIVDSLAVIFCLISINICLYFSPVKVTFLVPMWRIHMLISLATLLFCLASIMFCYVLSTILSRAETSYGFLAIIYALSLVMFMIIAIIGVAAKWEGFLDFYKVIDYIFVALVPGDAYKYFFSGLVTEGYIAHTNNGGQTGPSRISVGILALVFHIALYAALLYLSETNKMDLAWYFRFKNACSCCLRIPPPMLDEAAKDADVEEETAKASLAIQSPANIENNLVAAKLDKSYYKNVNVIKDLSFTVKKGECFGLLGVNGAGKSTTFSMLATEMAPDSGAILANGHYQNSELEKYRSTLGYDPQSNPALSLTPYQALALMAKLRGVDENKIPRLIKSITDLLEMSQHTHKLDSDLSGGTKRKLALGMALIGNPSILLLDEPTAGVDPFARRGVWRLLRAIRTRDDVSIVISSHAMEECEAICNRISIMAQGRLRCIGTFLHLRSKFAKGCTLRVQFSHKPLEQNTFEASEDGSRSVAELSSDPPTLVPMRRQPPRPSPGAKVATQASQSLPELSQLLDAAIGQRNYKLADQNESSLTFEILDNQVKRSVMFKTMREFRQKYPNVSYMINDSSLEDIFITLAKEQREQLATF